MGRDQFEQLGFRWEENRVMYIAEMGYRVKDWFHVVRIATSMRISAKMLTKHHFL
jgi:hypothetical protein